ncbi:histidine phosphatase family protein [Kribbella sp. NPDC058245]|uniref:histidine phosphatase family protein n=1 Tax=Kribbella sp. NPDC058245 TaxID=3346399 RepID=UPI0036E01C7A
MTRHLYLVRHAEALPDESGLTDRGRHQAVLLGQRLQDVVFNTIHHSPLPRATQTAHLISEQLRHQAPLKSSAVAGDYIPYVPQPAELPPDSAAYYLDFLAQATPEELTTGPRLAQEALTRFTGPTDLLVTHNFLIAWLIRDALEAPPWRWLTINHANAALTVITYAQGRPATVEHR